MNREEYISVLETDNASYKKENKKLQSNWNSLKEWLEENIKEKPLLTTYFFECDGKQKSISGIELEELKKVLDKMNELEGKDKE